MHLGANSIFDSIAWLNVTEGTKWKFSVYPHVSLKITRFGLVPQFKKHLNHMPCILVVYYCF